MAEPVTLTHPELPGRTIRIPEQGVPHRERAGWQRAEQTAGTDSPSSKTSKPAAETTKDSKPEGSTK
jgi:hypothetical protein